ncbi:MAG: aminopeptidase P family protein, partial [Candidatus Eremiobacteraeota bacterium]|nr:aminopeptidase P family protein [Candidatus Eremiobacteraeota bacterium]
MDTRNAPEGQAAKTATHDTPDTPKNLLDFMSQGWIDAPFKVATLANQEGFRRRRAALSNAYPDTYLIVPAGVEKVRANDTNFRFRASSDFAYLAGNGEFGALLVMEPSHRGHRTIIFVPAHNRGKAEFFTDRVYGELWVGRHRGVDESQLYYGVDACRPMSEIGSYLEEIRRSGAQYRVVRGDDESVDSVLEETDGDKEFATRIGEMRLFKDEFEITELRKCCEITKRGFEDVIAVLPHAKSEREIEAAFWSRARIEANDVGYLTIAAAGDHACTLHWTHNHGAVDKTGLLLLDAGVEAESLYTADITRTMPIGGNYSPQQRRVYEIVYRAQAAAFERCRAANDFLDPNRAAMRVLAEGLIDLGILKASLEEALDPENQYYRRYTLHNISHMLGIDVHDCARARSENYRYGKLQPGMAFTNEPGLYFQPDDSTVPQEFRGIGVRIEDDLVITQDGYENLSGILP